MAGVQLMHTRPDLLQMVGADMCHWAVENRIYATRQILWFWTLAELSPEPFTNVLD